MRAVKSPAELDLLRTASEKVVDFMLAVFSSRGPGSTKTELVDALRDEQRKRDLHFEYCLSTVGTSFNRAPSGQVWRRGEVLSLDSGGNYAAISAISAGWPSPASPISELEDLLGEVEEISRRRASRSGAGALSAAASAAGRAASSAALAAPGRVSEFVAHGMGIVSHEAPWLTEQGPGAPTRPTTRSARGEAGMVSIETTPASSGAARLRQARGHRARTGDWHEGFRRRRPRLELGGRPVLIAVVRPRLSRPLWLSHPEERFMSEIPDAPTLAHGSAKLSTGVRLHYVTVGDGPRTVVLVHGYPQTWWSWRHVVGPLAAAGFRVIAPDYRGAGRSSKPPKGYDKRTMAADIAVLLTDVLGVDRPVTMVGNDIGMMVAYAFGSELPTSSSASC